MRRWRRLVLGHSGVGASSGCRERPWELRPLHLPRKRAGHSLRYPCAAPAVSPCVDRLDWELSCLRIDDPLSKRLAAAEVLLNPLRGFWVTAEKAGTQCCQNKFLHPVNKKPIHTESRYLIYLHFCAEMGAGWQIQRAGTPTIKISYYLYILANELVFIGYKLIHPHAQSFFLEPSVVTICPCPSYL